MGDIWYGERITTPTTDCIGQPGAVEHEGQDPEYCVPENCGCGTTYTASSTDKDAYLPKRVDPAIKKPPHGDHPSHTIKARRHLKITNASGDDIYVICFHLQPKDEKHNNVKFWVGWECERPSGGQPVKACKKDEQGTVLVKGVVRVKSGSMAGNGKDIIIRLTRDSYDRVPLDCPERSSD
jgi:hypothetical protein